VFYSTEGEPRHSFDVPPGIEARRWISRWMREMWCDRCVSQVMSPRYYCCCKTVGARDYWNNNNNK
jgi:hypothetical protein